MSIRMRAENFSRHRHPSFVGAALLSATLAVVVVSSDFERHAAVAAADPVPGPEGSSKDGRCTQYEAALSANAPHGGWDVAKMSEFMWRESKCTPTVRSSTFDTGLLQINDVNLAHLRTVLGEWVGRWTLTDPIQNIRAAAVLCDYWQDHGQSCYYPWKIVPLQSPPVTTPPMTTPAVTTPAVTTKTTTTTVIATTTTVMAATTTTVIATKVTGAQGSTVSGRCTQYESALKANAPPGGWNVQTMSGYMSATSKCNPAKRWSSATGLLRISDVNLSHLTTVLGETVTSSSLTDPIQNIRAAAALCALWVKAGKSCYSPWGG